MKKNIKKLSIATAVVAGTTMVSVFAVKFYKKYRDYKRESNIILYPVVLAREMDIFNKEVKDISRDFNNDFAVALNDFAEYLEKEHEFISALDHDFEVVNSLESELTNIEEIVTGNYDDETIDVLEACVKEYFKYKRTILKNIQLYSSKETEDEDFDDFVDEVIENDFTEGGNENERRTNGNRPEQTDSDGPNPEQEEKETPEEN